MYEFNAHPQPVQTRPERILSVIRNGSHGDTVP